MAAKKRAGAKETTYLAAEDATGLWALVRSETRFTRRRVKGPDHGDEYHQRLLYLMAAAVFRTVQHLVTARRWRKLLDTIERYADGAVSDDQLFEECEAAESVRATTAAQVAVVDSVHLLCDDYKVIEGVDCVTDAAGYLGAVAAGVLKKDAGSDAGRAVWNEPSFQKAKHEHERALCVLIRDIFGNPFRPVAFDPAWRTDTAVSLARGMYESRKFNAMPILADALQDAGCDNEDILGHLRGDGPHVRGCWVVDLVLGRE